jgi:hypothetical protein
MQSVLETIADLKYRQHPKYGDAPWVGSLIGDNGTKLPSADFAKVK